MGTSLLGISSSIIDIDPAHLDAIDTQDLFIPDKFYVINFEHPHNYGPITMTIGSAASKYYQAWNDYCNAIRYNMDEFSRLSGYVTSQIDWRQVIAPMLSESVEYDGLVACSVIRCYGTDFVGTVFLYLLINDPAALVELGANSDDVSKLRSMIPDQEQKYIQRMYNRYKHTYLTEEDASDWDKMWMAYFGFQFYNPPALPSTPSSGSSAIMLLPPFVYTNGGIGVKGSFVRMSVVGSDTVAISSTSSGTKPLSEMAKYNGDASIWGGTLFFSNQNHMQVISSALSSGWVYCSAAVVQAYKLLKVGKGGMFGVNLQSSPVGAVLSRSYLDDLGRMRIRNVNALSLLQLGSMSIQGGFQRPNIYIFSLPV